jgi:AcrR family transcriptional regulator
MGGVGTGRFADPGRTADAPGSGPRAVPRTGSGSGGAARTGTAARGAAGRSRGTGVPGAAGARAAARAGAVLAEGAVPAGVRSRRLPRAERERQMLEAAVRVFGRHGYSAASMDGIAEAAGVSKPLLYLYLSSKDALFTECIRREAESLLAAVRAAALPGLPAERQLWAGLSAFFAHTAEHPHGWAVLHRQARTSGEPFAREAAAMRADLVGHVALLLTAVLRERSAQEPPASSGAVTAAVPGDGAGGPDAGAVTAVGPGMTALAQALVGAAESLAGWMNETGAVTADGAAETLMNLAWVGFGGLMKGERWPLP